MTIKTNIGKNLCKTIGKLVSHNGKECGKIIEYDPETGEATMEMNDSFFFPSHDIVGCSSRGLIIEDINKDENKS